MGKRDFLFLGLVLGGLVALGAGLMPPREPKPKTSHDAAAYTDPAFASVVAKLDDAFRKHWDEKGLSPAPPAPDLAVARRLSLALIGSIPSLEEIRQLEHLPAEQRLAWWLDHLMKDGRYSEYMAERLARAYVGTEDGPFILFRRRRLTFWLGDKLAKNRPYDEIVRELVSSRGLWTNEPATNFVSVTSRPAMKNQPDPVRLAGRSLKAFLALRLDCVECHDKPKFLPGRDWKQTDFHHVAAFFGQTRLGFTGIHDDSKGEYLHEPKRGAEPKPVKALVPYQPEMLPDEGTRRQRLAAWITDKRNPYFARAAVNRVWGLLLGRPLVSPVDNLEAEPEEKHHPALRLLADDFAANGFDLRRLIRVIASTRAFRLDSRDDPEPTAAHFAAWAAFPLTRLRPEQVAGGIIQASSVATIDHESHIIVRLIRYGSLNDFLARYGDTGGEDELEERGGTIPQALLRMNGQMVRERLRKDLFSASTRIADTLKDDARAVETAYLAVLTRRPTDEQLEHFVKALREPGIDRAERLADLFWTLANSTGFSWNH